ncbi:hypothetical protein DO628_22565 [Salmonella enterica subsp. salamae]|nr:hypothetical protein [Salmonella enterica subsp. salamae serovar Sofia]EBS4543933.1 hypothetical protein [Salmonella enterica subsp. salamae serovar Sofia]
MNKILSAILFFNLTFEGAYASNHFKLYFQDEKEYFYRLQEDGFSVEKKDAFINEIKKDIILSHILSVKTHASVLLDPVGEKRTKQIFELISDNDFKYGYKYDSSVKTGYIVFSVVYLDKQIRDCFPARIQHIQDVAGCSTDKNRMNSMLY